jgi:hypothetical protein
MARLFTRRQFPVCFQTRTAPSWILNVGDSLPYNTTYSVASSNHPVEIWDGTTYYEIDEDPSDEFTSAIVRWKFMSNSTTEITPVVGAGTDYIPITRSLLMALTRRVKIPSLSGSLSFSGSVGDVDYSISTGAIITGTPSVAFAAGTESEAKFACALFQPAFASPLTSTNNSDRLFFFKRYGYEDVVGGGGDILIDETSGEGSGTIDVSTVDPDAPAANVGSAFISARNLLHAPFDIFVVEETPDLLYVNLSQIIEVGFAAGQSFSGDGGSFADTGTSHGMGTSSGSSIEFGPKNLVSSFNQLSYDDPDSAFCGTGVYQESETESLSSPITFTMLGESIAQPRFLRSRSGEALAGDGPGCASNFSQASFPSNPTGSIDINAREFWEYRDYDGNNPLFDKDTGAEL